MPARGRRTVASFSDAELVAGFTGNLMRFSGMGFSSAEQFEFLDREAAAVCASLDDMGDDVNAATERPASLDVMDATAEGFAPFVVAAEATPTPHRPGYSSLSPAGAVTAAGVASSIAACCRR